MRTSGHLHRSAIAPAGLRKISEAFLTRRGIVVPLPLSANSSSSSGEASTGSSLMHCRFSSSSVSLQSLSIACCSSCTSPLVGFQTLVNPVRRGRAVQALLRCSFARDFCSGRTTGVPFSGSSCVSASAVASLSSPINSGDISALENEAPECSAASSPTSVYVHLPFCRRRCFYCDFPILAVGERTEQTKDHIDSTMNNYVDLVCKEIATTAKKVGNSGGTAPLKTVFFGGGTPSLLSAALLARIIEELKCHFQVASDAEISMEMDPGTFDRDKLAGFMSSGITRVSLGVQSFQAELLKACGRAHGLQEVHEAIEAIHSIGLKNWSLDLIASLPNQNLQQWEHSLIEAVSAKPAHISVYDLQIEEGTLFNRWFKAGQDPLPSDETSAEFYCTASRRLREAGYEHYEVSNYAMPGFQCRHNLVYWENRPYYAFGLGSTSYVEGRRFSRPRKLKEYATYVQNLEARGSESDDFPELSLEDQVLDTVMLSLRLARGLNLAEFEARFGSSLTSTVCDGLLPFLETGLVEVLDAQRQTIPTMYFQDRDNVFRTVATKELICNDASVVEACIEENPTVPALETARTTFADTERRAKSVRLTDPQGFLLSNEVISSIFAVLPSGGGI